MAALDARRLAGDFGFAIVAQVAAMVVGFANALLLPKLFSETTYGYWQLFLFYGMYCSVFSFGLVDGVYLILGGERRERLDKRAVNARFWVCMAIEAVCCAIFVGIGLAQASDSSRAAVFFGVAVYLICFNGANYLGYLFQAIGETRRYSVSCFIEAIAFLAVMLTLMLFGVRSFEPYVAAYVASRGLRLAYCAWYARDVLASGLLPLATAIRESLQTMSVGAKLLVSTISGSLIVGIARFVIDFQWSIEEFAVVSLAISLVNFFMTFTSQVAMVLFPALRRVEGSELSALFLKMRDGLALLLPAIYVVYGPLVVVLELWLPNYTASFELFSLLMPLCVFNGKMDVVGLTFMKVLRREGTLLRMNLTTFALAFAGALIGGVALHSITFIFAWIVVCIVGRCLLAEHLITEGLGLEGGWINLGSVALTAISVVACGFLGHGWSTLLVAGAYLVYLVVFRNETRKLLALAKSLGRG